MLYSYSNIDENTVKTIEDLEKKLNVTLLAFSANDVKNAELESEALDQIKSAEDTLGLTLVAVQA